MNTAASYGRKHFMQTPYYLCFVGYMQTIAPHVFTYSDMHNQDEIIDEGKLMMRLSVQIEPSNYIYQLLVAGCDEHPDSYSQKQKNQNQFIDAYFDDGTALSEYFRYIVRGDTM